MLDCVVIGTGAAGISAALTLKLLKRNFVLLGSKNLSAKISGAEKIKNYPGLLSASGADMQRAFLNQLAAESIEITEAKVNGVYPAENGYTVMCGGDVFETKTVIVASGVERVKQVEGEREFLGRGVSYCATCDGFLYKGKTIVVAAEDGEEDEVALLKSYAEKVYEIPARSLKKIKGTMRADAVEYLDGKELKELKADGVFVLKSAVAADSLVYGLKCENGAVTVGRDMATNLKGVFAAGDCTGRPYQYAKAVGEGNVAAHSVNNYLNKL